MLDAVHTEESPEGFVFNLYLLEEDESPRDNFMNEDGSDDEETIRKIADGTYLWFCAKVTCSKAGIVLGTDYLGACCYANVADFVVPTGYWPDMKAQALAEAKITLTKLCSCK